MRIQKAFFQALPSFPILPLAQSFPYKNLRNTYLKNESPFRVIRNIAHPGETLRVIHLPRIWMLRPLEALSNVIFNNEYAIGVGVASVG